MRLLAGSLLVVHWGHPRTKAAAPGWSATLRLAQQVQRSPSSRTGHLSQGHIPVSHLLQNQTANRKAKTRQKELFSGF